jgi:anti-anti-sigma factor
MVDASGPGILRIGREDNDGDAVLTLEGELDLSSAPALSRELDALEAAHTNRILIDLTDLTFMDSSGLTMVIKANQSAKRNGHHLSFRNASPQVRQLFELTGVLEELTFEE